MSHRASEPAYYQDKTLRLRLTDLSKYGEQAESTSLCTGKCLPSATSTVSVNLPSRLIESSCSQALLGWFDFTILEHWRDSGVGTAITLSYRGSNFTTSRQEKITDQQLLQNVSLEQPASVSLSVSAHPAFGSDTANLVWLFIISTLGWALSLYVYIFPTADKTAQRNRIIMSKWIDFFRYKFYNRRFDRNFKHMIYRL